MSDLFISYSSKDPTEARDLVERLLKRGYEVWWDPKLRAGEQFRDKIQAQLELAKAVIVIWTPNSVASPWVRDEADYAYEKRKLIATRVKGVAFNDIPLGFRGVQTELIDETDRILRALEALGLPPRTPAEPAKPDEDLRQADYAEWDRIKDAVDPAVFERFANVHATSQLLPLAKGRISDLRQEVVEWTKVESAPTFEALQQFLDRFPNGAKAADARALIAPQLKAREAQAWSRVKDSKHAGDFDDFLRRFPDGQFAELAKARLKALGDEREQAAEWEKVKTSQDDAVIEKFIHRFPVGRYADEAREHLRRLQRDREERTWWEQIRDGEDLSSYERFLRAFPDGRYADDARERMIGVRRKAEMKRWSEIKDTVEPATLIRFVATFPDGALRQQAELRLRALPAILEQAAWTEAQTGGAAALEAFLAFSPAGRFASSARQKLGLAQATTPDKTAAHGGRQQAAFVATPATGRRASLVHVVQTLLLLGLAGLASSSGSWLLTQAARHPLFNTVAEDPLRMAFLATFGALILAAAIFPPWMARHPYIRLDPSRFEVLATAATQVAVIGFVARLLSVAPDGLVAISWLFSTRTLAVGLALTATLWLVIGVISLKRPVRRLALGLAMVQTLVAAVAASRVIADYELLFKSIKYDPVSWTVALSAGAIAFATLPAVVRLRR